MANVVQSIGDIKAIFSTGYKTILKRLLNDAIALIDSEELCDSSGLGVLAGHLEALANYIDPTDEQFELGRTGDIKDPQLCERLQGAWLDKWREVVGSRFEHLRPADSGVATVVPESSNKIEMWNVWVVDYIERTSEIVLEAVSLNDANEFVTVWDDKDSLVVVLPIGFDITREGIYGYLAKDPLTDIRPGRRCYTEAAKTKLISILLAGIKGVQMGFIGSAGDFGILAMRLATACEQFDCLPNPGDGNTKIIDAMVNEWDNETLDSFLDAELNLRSEKSLEASLRSQLRDKTNSEALFDVWFIDFVSNTKRLLKSHLNRKQANKASKRFAKKYCSSAVALIVPRGFSL